MKPLIRILSVSCLVLCSALPSLADCRLLAVSNVPAGTSTLILPDTSKTPAAVAAGGNSEPLSGVLVWDDNALGMPQCLAHNQVITITLNAQLASPTTITADNISVIDSDPSNSAAVSPTLTPGLQGATLTFSVSRPGTVGDPTASPTGSALWIKNLRGDLTNFSAGTFVNATMSTSLPGSRYSASTTSVTIGSASTAGPVALSATNLKFGQEIVGTTSQPQVVRFSNNGQLGISFSGFTTSAGFAQTNTCGTHLDPNSSCTISVTFGPSTVGDQSGSITIPDNALGNPHVITLSGTGVASPGTPSLTTLTPSRVIAGGPAFQLLVNGANFGPGSVVLFNGSPRATTFVAADTLKANILDTDIAGVGTAAAITVSNVGVVSNSLSIQIAANPFPATPFQYALPHVPQGGGFITKITLTNLSNSVSDSSIVIFLDQNGSVVNTVPYSIPPLGTVRLTTPPAARFGPALTPQWAVVSSQTQLAVNLFFELTDTAGHVLNSVGFNNTVPATDVAVPVELERPVANGPFTRTDGIAIANMSDTANQVQLQLFDSAGRAATGIYSLELAPYGQTAFDLALVPMFAGAVSSGNLVGTVNIAATRPVAAVALVDDKGPFASTPPVIGRSNQRADTIAGMCPPAVELNQINHEMTILFESDPTAGTLVCRTAEGSLDLTQAQLRAYQALRVIRNVAFDAPLPFTNKRSVYDWLRTTAVGIRFRGDIATSGCCSTRGFLDISLTASNPALTTSAWLGPQLASVNSGLDTLVADIVRVARIGEGIPDTCGALDATISEAGPWAVALDWQDFISVHGSTFFDDTISGETVTRYRDVAAGNALAYLSPSTTKFCSVGGISTVQPIAGVDFGSHTVGDPPLLRSVAVNSTNGTPFSGQPSSIDGVNSDDFSIVSDGCNNQVVPPSCVVVVGFSPRVIGNRSAQLTLGSLPPVTVPLAGSGVTATPIPVAPYIYYLPHVVSGNGYVTKITLSNQANVGNNIVVQFLTQAGKVAQSTRYTIAAGGALRIATPEASRFLATTTQWVVIGSTQPLLANLFFEVEDSTGTIINTVGFNSSDSLSNFSFPVEFEPQPDGTPGGRTAGLAMANPQSIDASYTMTLFNANGVAVATTTGKVPAFGQVAVDLATIASFRSVLPKANFVGSVQVLVTGRVVTIALEDDFGPFSATPVVPIPIQ